MRKAHRQGHRGRDGTLAKFREMYWVPRGSKLAQTVKYNCQLCKLRQAKLLQQEMGQLPEARLKPAPPFTHVMHDLVLAQHVHLSSTHVRYATAWVAGFNS